MRAHPRRGSSRLSSATLIMALCTRKSLWSQACQKARLCTRYILIADTDMHDDCGKRDIARSCERYSIGDIHAEVIWPRVVLCAGNGGPKLHT
jgi:hypothetical protein